MADNNLININEYKKTRLSTEEIRKMTEERRQKFYDIYGAEPRPGESEAVKCMREAYNINMELVAHAIAKRSYGLSDENATVFEERREASELEKLICNIEQLEEEERKADERLGFNVDEMLDQMK